MAPKDGELVPGSFNVVVVKTSTVTRVVLPVPATFMVKVVGAVAPGAVTTVPDSLTAGTVTEVAPTVLVPPWVPVTLTWSPAKMALKDGEPVPGSLKVVVVETSTVTKVEAVAVSTQFRIQLPWSGVEPVPATFMVKVVAAVAPGAVTTVPDSLTAGSVTEMAPSVL
jgi:putative lipoic acid-binding regulatory protein